jgi:hypothetical protein
VSWAKAGLIRAKGKAGAGPYSFGLGASVARANAKASRKTAISPS